MRWSQSKSPLIGPAQTVGQSLEEMRANGAIVFHDIPAKKFNVDHIVISRNGVFVIETKTRRKPNGRSATVVFDGEKLFVDGISPDRDPIQQVKAISSRVQELIWESTGKSFPVKPVVLFPGWYVETINPAANKKVWVLNPKNLQSFMQHEKGKISPEDVNLIAYHISRYIRTSDASRYAGIPPEGQFPLPEDGYSSSDFRGPTPKVISNK